MNSRDCDGQKQKSIWELVLEQMNRETDLSRQYAAAQTVDELLVPATDRLTLATAVMMMSFRAHRLPGKIWLRLLKFVAAGRYRRLVARNHRLFVQCLIHATARLIEYVGSSSGPSREWLFDKFVGRSAGWYGRLLWGNSDAEKQMLKDELLSAMEQHARSPPKDFNEQLFRIMSCLKYKGTTRAAVEIGRYIRDCHLDDPVVALVEPHWLGENLKRVTADQESR